MMFNAQSKSALKALYALREEYKHYIKRGYEDAEGLGRRVWALNYLEDLIFESPDPPLVVIGKFGDKMNVYSKIDAAFEDCVLACETLDAMLT